MSDERRIKLYVFDADGTLRRSTVPGLPCPNKPGEWELIPGVRERLARISWGEGGARFGVATNQGGVGLGYLTLGAARGLLEAMVAAAVEAYERDIIQDALKTARGSRKKAAKLLDTTERIIGYKVKKYGIDCERFRP